MEVQIDTFKYFSGIFNLRSRYQHLRLNIIKTVLQKFQTIILKQMTNQLQETQSHTKTLHFRKYQEIK